MMKVGRPLSHGSGRSSLIPKFRTPYAAGKALSPTAAKLTAPCLGFVIARYTPRSNSRSLPLHNIRQGLADGRVRVPRQRRDRATFQLWIRLIARDPYQLVGRSLVGETRINIDQRAA